MTSLTIKTPERRSGVFIVNIEKTSHIGVPIADFEQLKSGLE